jgi:hypothetical protein
MTTMAEIEKAIKELEIAARNMESWQMTGLPSWFGFNEVNAHLIDARTKLIELIEGLAQYQPREVSNDRT